MWVFNAESLSARCELDETLRWWLDYWLFLNGDDTHPVWCVRPLGLRSLASAALASDASSDWTLRERLKYETAIAAKLSPFLPDVPVPPSVPLIVDGASWSGPWSEWIVAMAACDPVTIARNLIVALSAAIAESRMEEAAYLSRRLAAELASEGWSERQIWSTAKDIFLDSGKWANRPIERDRLGEALQSTFAASSRRYYTVTFAVLPVQVTNEIVNTVGRGGRLILERDADRLRLTGIKNKVYAAHAEHAVVKSHRVAAGILETLRLSFYIRSNLYGAAKVIDDSTTAESWVSLTQPFWTKRRSARKVPSFPPGVFAETQRKIPAHTGARWNAAKWHLSQAFAGWAEDVHSSAAKVWQALEAFAPGNQKPLVRVQEAGRTYLSLVCPDMASYLRMKLARHRKGLAALAECNFGDRASHDPEPRVLFDRNIGLLGILSRRLRRPDSEAWMDTRVESDLALLYGLRNKVVHSGARVLPDRMAAYLASLGAEIIFALMTKAASELTVRPLQANDPVKKDEGDEAE